jgi:hypothetical protein
MIWCDDIDEFACFNDMMVVLANSVSSCIDFPVLKSSLPLEDKPKVEVPIKNV